MARKSKIRFEWDGDKANCLLAIRDHGRITLPELKSAMAADENLHARVFVVTWAVHDNYDMYDWDGTEPEGDTWELYEVMDGDPCPICDKVSQHTFCPDCGKYVFPGMV